MESDRPKRPRTGKALAAGQGTSAPNRKSGRVARKASATSPAGASAKKKVKRRVTKRDTASARGRTRVSQDGPDRRAGSGQGPPTPKSRRSPGAKPASDSPVRKRPASRDSAPGASSEGRGSERLQKWLAAKGLGSRRELEVWIAAGRVSVNGQIVGLGTKVGPNDVVRVDGKRVMSQSRQPATRVLAYNKPPGEICSRDDPEHPRTVFDRLPALASGRWICVGRLDIATQGLLLFTNDGELAHRLMHPSYQLEREYAVRVLGVVDRQTCERLREGVYLDDGFSRFDAMREAGGEGANHWYHVTLSQGRNREVHRLWESQGVRVSRLVRVRYGTVKLAPWLKTGRYAELEAEELTPLLRSVSLRRTVRERPGASARRRRDKRHTRRPVQRRRED